MRERSRKQTTSTRRDALKYGSAAVAGSALAGCSDLLGTGGGNSAGTPGEGSYTVEMAPMGTVQFESVPERWLPYSGGYADMGVALGQADGMTGIGQTSEYYTGVYDDLPDVSVDQDQLDANDLVDNGMSRELFYDLDNDVHLIDTGMLRQWFDWSQSDVDEISEGVGPFLGNLIFRREDEWHDYRYYTLYEAFEKVATLFQERERFRAFERLHDEFIAGIQTQLPPASDRPNVLLTYEHTDEPESFSPYRLNDQGTSKKQWRDLGVGDALAGTGIQGISTTDRGELDYEGLLEIDPDVLLVRGHERKSAREFRDSVLDYMRSHPLGSELSAVESGRVYRGGYLKQGPIQNLFLTERAAQQIYPDLFGSVASDERLFDRQRVADIVNGEF